MQKFCDERPEIVELCKNCKHPDCVGVKGCKEYQTLKCGSTGKKKPREPAIAFVEAPETDKQPESLLQHDTAETLKRCNAAIIALETLYKDAGSDLVFPTMKIAEMLEILRVGRMEAYSAHIDWDMIAESMKGGEEK